MDKFLYFIYIFVFNPNNLDKIEHLDNCYTDKEIESLIYLI